MKVRHSTTKYVIANTSLVIVLILGLALPNHFASASDMFSRNPEECKDNNVIQKNNDRLEQFEFPGPGEDMNHVVQVYLPIGYTDEKKYPVLYLHDGGLLFNPGDDRDCLVDETMDYLQKEGHIGDGIIVVGIFSNQARWDEYSPYVNRNMHYWVEPSKANPHEGGEGDAYLKFMNGLIKHIDNAYSTINTAEGRAIGGFSMGGLISIYAGLKSSDTYSKVLAMSPAVWFAETDTDNIIGNHNQLIDEIASMTVPGNVKFYIDIGINEWEGEEQGDYSYPEIWEGGAKKLFEVLSAKVPKDNIMLLIDKKGIHEPSSWTIRVGHAILWLYNGRIPEKDQFEIITPTGNSQAFGAEMLATKDISNPLQQSAEQISGIGDGEITPAPLATVGSGNSNLFNRFNITSFFLTVFAIVLLVLVFVVVILLIRQLIVTRRKD